MNLDTSRPFTRAEALANGLTVSDLASRRFKRLFHDSYLSALVPVGQLERAQAALKVCPPTAYVSHHTAGALWGGWVPDTDDVHVTVPPGSVRSRRSGIASHRGEPGLVPASHRGVLLSPPVHVFGELASLRLSLVDLVVFGDSLVRARRLKPEDLVAAFETRSGRGCRRARRAAGLVRSGVDSAQESRLRLLLVLAGLPEPEVNRIIRTVDGEWSRRFDLCYPALRIIVEYEGKHHARDPEQWARDVLRREQLERQGWTLIIVTADALFNHPDVTVARVSAVLRERGCREMPVRLNAEWQRHFPTRSSL